MRFTEYKGDIFKKSTGFKRLEAELKEFLKMNVKVAKVTFTKVEYKSVKSCYHSLTKAVARYSLPIDVTTRKGEIFIINKEID